MSQVTSVFITVTATVTGSAVPTLNATELQDLRESQQTGQTVALVALGIFGLLALILLLCWGILCIRRKPPPAMVENLDAARQGRGAFLPIIRGRGRKSDVGMEAARGGGGGGEGASSRQSFIGHGASPGGRRLSMWADDGSPYTPPVPSPPTLAEHSRSSSTESIEHAGRYDHHRSHSNASLKSTSSIPPNQNYGYVPQYHDGASTMDFVALESPPLSMVPPNIERVDRALPRVEVARYTYEERRVSPVVSPLEDVQLGILRHPHNGSGNARTYDSGMFA